MPERQTIQKHAIVPAENEIVVYQPDETLRLDVRLEDETVWLNRHQMAKLFGRDVKTIGKHIANALAEELSAGIDTRNRVVAKFATTAADGKTYLVEHYNLDVILSVGYRVKSPQGILFRIWANSVLKQYLLRGYAFNQRIAALEDRTDRRIAAHDTRISTLERKVDFFVQTQTPPLKGVFYDGQLWDARAFVEKLVKSAKKSLVVIDNWVTVETLDMFAAKKAGVSVRVVTSEHRDRKGNPRPKILPADIAKFNAQYPSLSVSFSEKFHDRFIILDDADLYLIGASLKDLGKKCFGFTKMDASEIPAILARMVACNPKCP